MSTIRPARPSDWIHFCTLAAVEGWRVPQSELQRFQTDWSNFVQVLEIDGGFAGLVTAVPHERSGWIGNLIVPPHLRGRGYGGRLFRAAQKYLTDRGMSTIWLTASEQGRPLYEKFGFVVVERVERWALPAVKRSPGGIKIINVNGDVLTNADRLAWSEKRYSFLERLSPYSQLLVDDGSVALLQKGPDLQIIGPWYSRNPCAQSSRLLLQQLVDTAEPSLEIIVDLFTSSPLHGLFVSAGFVCVGQTDLMALGDVSSVDFKMMVSLASLGSIG